MTDCAMLWVDLCETIPFWFLNDDPTYSSSIVFILRNIIRFLPRMPYSRLRKDPLVLLYCLKFSVIRIIRRLSKKFYSILLYDLFSLNANFMNSCKLYHHRFFQYFNSFRFTEFPSLWETMHHSQITNQLTLFDFSNLIFSITNVT